MFDERMRRIFTFLHPIDGVTIYADPLQIHRELQAATGGKLNATIAQHNQGQEPEAGPEAKAAGAQAQGALIAAAYSAFRLAPLDPITGEGVLEEEAFAVLTQYLTWKEQKKTSGGT